ncbi:TVP38/TMEM64 family protein [Clostridium paridis]|uniref:TVP38/TMEM64 family membrane protein n=1 Tax=Clostridium paridis TaxID=2803863 RepID=A0A937FDE0_9CLOT|nr:VTT domain-containing protein [Clostridium paridis]MBL4931794.1 TVP38/TMEM64 family protein [Clostridium paridis]
MNKLFKIIICLFWLVIIFIFFKHQLYNDGIAKITMFLKTYPEYSRILLFIIASFRIFTFVPFTVFIIISSMLFGPVETFFLTTTANLVSEVLLFFFAKFTIGMKYQDKIIEKYPKIYNVIERNNTQILALGVSSPVIPSDVVCFLSVLTGISLKKYILTILLADTPIILLYTCLGISSKYSISVFIATSIVIAIISYFNYKDWKNKIQS